MQIGDIERVDTCDIGAGMHTTLGFWAARCLALEGNDIYATVGPQAAGIRARRPRSKLPYHFEAARAVSAKVDSGEGGSRKRVPSFDAPLHCRSSYEARGSHRALVCSAPKNKPPPFPYKTGVRR